MGALHEGHLSLAKASKEKADFTIATIFVNPTQFAAGEDLDQYPRTLDNDIQLLNQVGVDLVFAPDNDQIYPAGFSTLIQPPKVSLTFEGEHRPTHFGGVATVVLKLLNMTRATFAFFGQKDYQQSLVIQRMVDDLNVPCQIVICPIVRDADGLALSSRNRYLSDAEREQALSLSRTLRMTEQLIREGELDTHIVMNEMKQSLIDGGVDMIDYAMVARADDLTIPDEIELPAVCLVAAHVGSTRLIDNCVIRS
jgi:pantoate--beta-alanine ligase